EPECILKYMRIPSTAGTRDPERSRFFHKLSGQAKARPFTPRTVKLASTRTIRGFDFAMWTA
ncbi:MAG: hypothetical protein ACREXY_26695, partial [Gammaproteobacteria bacterium]